MEVILKEDVNNLGHRGDVVKVAEGYGRNYLLPKKLAMEANAANKAVIEQMKASAVRRSAKEKAEAEALVTQLNNVALVFERKVGENDHLFGSVTSADIAQQLERRASTSTAARCNSKSRSSSSASSTSRSSCTAKSRRMSR